MNDTRSPSGRRRGRRKPASAPAAPAHDDGAAPAPEAPAERPARAPRRRERAAAASPAPAAPASAAVASAPPVPLIRVPLSVRWRDLDAFNHVNNSKFLSYLEEARLRWMVTIPGEWLDEHVAPVVAAANVNYRRPIEWPNEVLVELFVERLGTTSLTIGHRILQAGDERVLYADGNVVMVWIDKDTGKAAPLPEAVRAACTPA